MTDRRDLDQLVAPWGEDEVAALFRLAGTPPALAEDEVRPIREAARESWRRQLHRRATRRRSMVVAATLAASLVIAGGLAWLGTGRGSAPPAAPVAALEVQAGEVTILPAGRVTEGSPELVAGAVLATGRDGRVALKLAAGASVRLDGESRVRLESARSFGLERGALYVDSRRIPGQHVEILTPLGTVTDLGTQFEVRLSAVADGRESELRVRVREGEVRVDTLRGTHRALAGSELVLASDGGTRRGAVAADDAGWQWAVLAAPAPVIEGRTLESFLDWVSRETGLPWLVVEPRLEGLPGATVLHGSVEGLTPQEALEVVLTGSGLRSERAGGELRISVAEAGGD